MSSAGLLKTGVVCWNSVFLIISNMTAVDPVSPEISTLRGGTVDMTCTDMPEILQAEQ